MIYDKLQKIQLELKAPKNKRNNFGGYQYRDLSGILESLKPLLQKYKCAIFLSDNVVTKEDRTYIESTATIIDCEDSTQYYCKGYAREDESKKGMDLSQLTGACSSYARKYALNGLLAIDDSQDIDSMDNTKQEKPKRTRRSRIVKQNDECPF
nr:MAG TPA: ERF superfamily protein [Caudoviricetes sp.]